MIHIIDDFLPEKYYNEIEKIIKDNTQFPWYYVPNITYTSNLKNQVNTPGFSTSIIDETHPVMKYSQFILPFALHIAGTVGGEVLRVKANMTLPTKTKGNDAHIDSNSPHYAGVLFVGESDGDTIIYQETVNYDELDPSIPPTVPDKLTPLERVSPKPNRLVLFDGSHWHSGEAPTSGSRVLLNVNISMP